MTRRVYKYSLHKALSGAGVAAIDVPFGAKFLTLALQQEVPCVWYIVDPDEKAMQRHKFHLVGTGIDFEPNLGVVSASWMFRGTVLLAGGALVLHFFEVFA